MNLEAQEYYNIASWLKEKVHYHKSSKHNKIKRTQVNYGEIWYCDLGCNIGAEKNKCRPAFPVIFDCHSFFCCPDPPWLPASTSYLKKYITRRMS